jgi:hypothetical protein
MQNDENTNALEVETKDEIAESVEDTETDAAGEESQGDESSDSKKGLTLEERVAKAEAEAAKFRRLFNKSQKPKPGNTEVKAEAKPQSPQASVEETVLRANGMPEELLKTLKKVAAVNGTGLLDAQKDDLFVAAKSKFDREEREKKSSVGASRGSGRSVQKPGLSTPGLSKEDHEALWREAVGR